MALAEAAIMTIANGNEYGTDTLHDNLCLTLDAASDRIGGA